MFETLFPKNPKPTPQLPKPTPQLPTQLSTANPDLKLVNDYNTINYAKKYYYSKKNDANAILLTFQNRDGKLNGKYFEDYSWVGDNHGDGHDYTPKYLSIDFPVLNFTKILITDEKEAKKKGSYNDNEITADDFASSYDIYEYNPIGGGKRKSRRQKRSQKKTKRTRRNRRRSV